MYGEFIPPGTSLNHWSPGSSFSQAEMDEGHGNIMISPLQLFRGHPARTDAVVQRGYQLISMNFLITYTLLALPLSLSDSAASL